MSCSICGMPSRCAYGRGCRRLCSSTSRRSWSSVVDTQLGVHRVAIPSRPLLGGCRHRPQRGTVLMRAPRATSRRSYSPPPDRGASLRLSLHLRTTTTRCLECLDSLRQSPHAPLSLREAPAHPTQPATVNHPSHN
ncbi:Uncharacterised protein [Chlamydia trachomatis]|nr:Uncharacterised protein [Chlamydia trachomatis]